MATDLNDLTLIQYHDTIGLLNGLQAVGNDDGGSPSGQPLQCFLNK